jgi:hypothetical protein
VRAGMRVKEALASRIVQLCEYMGSREGVMNL